MDSLASDAFDYKGERADKTTTGRWVSAATILVIEVAERIATMGILTNLVTYTVDTMHLPSATASIINSTFTGFSYLISLFGAIISDSILGRYWSITIFSIISGLGSCFLAITAALPQLRPPPCNPTISNQCVEAKSFQMGIFYLALYTYGLGLGGVKSNVSGFGSDQFDPLDEKEKNQMTYFFGRFYIVISMGTLLGVTVFVYIQDNVSRSWGYSISSAVMAIAVLTFLSRTRKYRYKKRTGSPLVEVLQVLVAAVRKRNLEYPSTSACLYQDPTQESTIRHNVKFGWLDKATIISKDEDYKSGGVRNPWKLCTVTKVEEVKMLIKLLPIWATTIMYWTAQLQMNFSVQQASTMDRSLGNLQIPAASFHVFMVLSGMATLAIYDRIVPHLKESKGTRGLTCLQKIGVGHIFSILSMLAADFEENRRLSVARANEHATTLPITAFVLVPQFVLMGISNGFVYSGQLDFFTTQSPKQMKAIGTALFLTTVSLGAFFSTAIVTIIRKVTGRGGGHNWLPRRINDSRLDRFYLLIAALCAVNFVAYVIFAMRYNPNDVPNFHKIYPEVDPEILTKDEKKLPGR